MEEMQKTNGKNGESWREAHKDYYSLKNYVTCTHLRLAGMFE